MTPLVIPKRLAETCRANAESTAWLEALPALVDEVVRRWSLTLGKVFDNEETTAAWVSAARRADGASAVLKLPLPHFEATHEIDGLRLWNGDGTVKLLESDSDRGAMLLERCLPGTSLREAPAGEQDDVIARLLRRMWRPAPSPSVFRPLAAMLAFWAAEVRARQDHWKDPALVEAGLVVFAELSDSTTDPVLLATDLHAGNILRAQREPWLAIDPKPFIGDRAYDATQHLLNSRRRLAIDPRGTIERFASLLEVDAERVLRWTVARMTVDAASVENDAEGLALARFLAK